jgi:osmoprotectant transport system substrate-binding protein
MTTTIIRRPLRLLLTTALVAAVPLGLTACGSDDDSDSTSSTSADTTASTTSNGSTAAITKDDANAKVKITIGSKNFTEQQVLGQVYAQALGAAGYDVKTSLDLGDEQTALKALKTNQISAYPEYTGTALGSFFKVPSKQIPSDSAKAYEIAKADFAKEDLVALPPTPFASSNEVGVTQATAKKYGLTTISDLSKVAGKLSLYGTPECRRRDDCLKGLKDVYGLKFKKFVPIDPKFRSDVLKSGKADVSIVFTTDPQNARDKFVLLKDDKGMFPPSNSTLVFRKDVADAAGPDLEKTIAAVNAQLTVPNIQELNARVDLDKNTPADAAKAFLQSYKLVAK